ncbi:hypothetical protein HPB47_027233, partial [Ixodes persulcatus]
MGLPPGYVPVRDSCYQKMLEAGHFDFDRLATSSSDDDEIVRDELAVARDDPAGEDPCMSNDTGGCERWCRHKGTKFGSCTGGACSCSNVPSIARTGESDDPCRRKDKMECSVKCHNVDYVSGHCFGRVCHCMKHDSLYPGPTLSELGTRQVAGAPTKREAAPERLLSNGQTARGSPKRSPVFEQFHEDK